MRDDGLAALSLRHLADRAGTTTPTIYSYFPSKHDIYDAMFAEAASEFAVHMGTSRLEGAAGEALAASFRRFIGFCMEDDARYQLLFERTIPGFRPSAEAYAPAARALESARAVLALNGIHDPRHLDLWTALTTGVVSQQIANEPGGERWTQLVDEVVAMFLDHCRRGERAKEAVT